MTGEERDRLIVLEVKTQHNTMILDTVVAKLDDLSSEVRHQSNILEQAKGAKYVMAALWMGFGGVGGAMLLKLLALVGLKIGP